ncbi:MAG: MBL fold metallo-hydrolase [Oscillospiraceae bacterium]
MENSAFTSELLKPDTWLISGEGASAYLLVGSERGIMIDSGESTEDIHAYVTTLTDKPVELVLNTHGHFDHTGGNGFFRCALMGRLAAEIAKEPNGGQDVSRYPTDYPIVVIEDGFKIDLGGRVIEAFGIDGHSPGSMVYLDTREGILFGGDSVGPVVPMRYKCADPQPSMLLFVQNLCRIMARRSEFSCICTGHGRKLFDAKVVDDCLICALRALNGEEDPAPAPPANKKKKGRGDFEKRDPAWNGNVSYGDARIMFDKRYIRDLTQYDVVQGT